MEQTEVKSKSWMLPFWFMTGIAILCFLENLTLFKANSYVAAATFSWYILIEAITWPFIILIEAIIYWRIRKRIENRKWVWAHLLFSLFSFVLLVVLYFIALYCIFFITGGEGYSYYLTIMKRIQFYAFWSGVVVGNIFFIVAIVQSFSYQKSPLPADSNDLLGEVADLKH
ncbi:MULTISPECIES: hypothetical protein [Niastella]|uniref:Signal peptidase I n=1 Tax=Niastella soli TaxID=2821487 RepID=A0ABS3YUN9_9BACT|nr:hypothetical protein [Niastella soli]MBO9201252.1 hypothetical protein [Niastella soli]